MKNELIGIEEHLEHVAGCASESQNCLHEAENLRRSRGFEQGDKIAAALAEGFCVVVYDYAQYCRATDACAGSIQFFGSAHRTRSEAESSAAASNARLDYDDDHSGFYVLPRIPVAYVAPAEPADDGVPF